MGLCGNIGRYLRGEVLGTVYDSKLNLYGYIIYNDVIGHGSFSKICRASKNGQSVAVKIIDREKTSEIFEKNYVSREIDILKKIRHRNIVMTHRIFEYPPKIYIFMELIEGPTLQQYISDNDLVGEDKARLLFQQLVDAFDYLHKKQISHRDLKPENVMIQQEDEVKVIDFGFAIQLGTLEDLNLVSWGRSPYTAPEVSHSMYDPLAFDIWSLGGVLFFIVTGVAPFSSSSEEKLIQDQTLKSIAYTPDCKLSVSLRKLINGMLEPDAMKRLTIDQVSMSDWTQKGISVRPVSSDNSNLEHDAAEANLLQKSISTNALEGANFLQDTAETNSQQESVRSLSSKDKTLVQDTDEIIIFQESVNSVASENQNVVLDNIETNLLQGPVTPMSENTSFN